MTVTVETLANGTKVVKRFTTNLAAGSGSQLTFLSSNYNLLLLLLVGESYEREARRKTPWDLGSLQTRVQIQRLQFVALS